MKRPLTLLLLVAFALPAHAEEPKIAYQKFALPNGLAVYVIEDPKAPTVYEVLWWHKGERPNIGASQVTLQNTTTKV